MAEAPAGPSAKRPRGRPPGRGKLGGGAASYARSLPHMKREVNGEEGLHYMASDSDVRITEGLRVQLKSKSQSLARQPHVTSTPREFKPQHHLKGCYVEFSGTPASSADGSNGAAPITSYGRCLRRVKVQVSRIRCGLQQRSITRRRSHEANMAGRLSEVLC